jgi:DNA repair protein RecO (recombination protein O)
MPLIETESLILKTYDLADADKIVLLLTRDHGIVRGVAKGAKRLKSRFGSALEPFTVVRATYFQKEVLELVSIQKLDLIESYFETASDPDFLQKFSYLTDILVGSLPPQDPSETLYRMTRACLIAARRFPDRLVEIGLYFEIWLLKLTGYLPQWRRCSECEREFGTAEPTGLGVDHELVCGGCRRLSSMTSVGAIERATLSDALRLSPSDFAAQPAGRVSFTQLSDIFKRIISQTLGRPVRENRPLVANINGQK